MTSSSPPAPVRSVKDIKDTTPLCGGLFFFDMSEAHGIWGGAGAAMMNLSAPIGGAETDALLTL